MRSAAADRTTRPRAAGSKRRGISCSPPGTERASVPLYPEALELLPRSLESALDSGCPDGGGGQDVARAPEQGGDDRRARWRAGRPWGVSVGEDDHYIGSGACGGGSGKSGPQVGAATAGEFDVAGATDQLGRQPPPRTRLRRRRDVLLEQTAVQLLRCDPGRVAHAGRSPRIDPARHRRLLSCLEAPDLGNEDRRHATRGGMALRVASPALARDSPGLDPSPRGRH